MAEGGGEGAAGGRGRGRRQPRTPVVHHTRWNPHKNREPGPPSRRFQVRDTSPLRPQVLSSAPGLPQLLSIPFPRCFLPRPRPPHRVYVCVCSGVAGE